MRKIGASAVMERREKVLRPKKASPSGHDGPSGSGDDDPPPPFEPDVPRPAEEAQTDDPATEDGADASSERKT